MPSDQPSSTEDDYSRGFLAGAAAAAELDRQDEQPDTSTGPDQRPPTPDRERRPVWFWLVIAAIVAGLLGWSVWLLRPITPDVTQEQDAVVGELATVEEPTPEPTTVPTSPAADPSVPNDPDVPEQQVPDAGSETQTAGTEPAQVEQPAAPTPAPAEEPVEVMVEQGDPQQPPPTAGPVAPESAEPPTTERPTPVRELLDEVTDLLEPCREGC